MLAKVCYLGDDHLGAAAAYLAGVMTYYGMAFDHVPSSESPAALLAGEPYALYVLSDYPAARFQAGQMETIARHVRGGAGLLMIGGWESFFGRLGEYHVSPLAEVLPVAMLDRDDRRNFAQPCLIRKLADHEILEGLPWDAPPGIGGLNQWTAKRNAKTLLAAAAFHTSSQAGRIDFTQVEELPLLVVGDWGEGRTAALATDVAPHWVGGFVDWGDRRVFQEVGQGFIEVGNWYAQFFRNLLAWTGRLNAR